MKKEKQDICSLIEYTDKNNFVVNGVFNFSLLCALLQNLAKRYWSLMLNNLVIVHYLKANRPYLLSANLIYWKPLEFVERRTYCSLKRAWISFKIAKKEGNQHKMKYYAEGTQKFQRQLRLPVSNFSDILKEETKNDLDSPKLNKGSGVSVNEL
jgi:hypothetical protein